MYTPEDKFKKKNILIYGFGKSGRACFNYLKQNNNIWIYDDKIFSLSKNLDIFFIKKKKIFSKKIDFIVISPGININKCGLKKYIKKNKKKIISELDIFYAHNVMNKKITITGTNGKSTTSKLLYEILIKHNKDARLVGNIGSPMLEEKNITKNTIFVIEASSYQIEYSKYFKTNFAVILNISPDHLERHGKFKNYVRSKFKLILNQQKNNIAFIEQNNLYLEKELKLNKIKSKIIKVNNNISKNISKKIINPYFKNINNIKNLKFVLEISRKLNLKINRILEVVNQFKGLDFRQQILFKNKKLTVINDSKSTTFSSTHNLLKSYKNIYWILGGMGKKGDKFNLNKKYFTNIVTAYIYGKNKSFFIKNLKNKIKYKTFGNLKKALEKTLLDTKKNHLFPKNIILSPAAASFDQFKNFEHRGHYFNNLVKKLSLIKKINV